VPPIVPVSVSVPLVRLPVIVRLKAPVRSLPASIWVEVSVAVSVSV